MSISCNHVLAVALYVCTWDLDFKLLHNPYFYFQVRYPKVGNDNPVNNLWLTDLTNITTSQILPPPSLHGEVHFSHVTWANPGQKFAVTWFNRVQNESVLTLCDVSDLDCSSHEIFKRVSKMHKKFLIVFENAMHILNSSCKTKTWWIWYTVFP